MAAKGGPMTQADLEGFALRRLETQVVVPKGIPPLKKMITLLKDLEAAVRSNDKEQIAAKATAALQHVHTPIEFFFEKSQHILRREKTEQEQYAQRKEKLGKQTEEVKKLIETRKEELVEARHRRKQLEEYEAIRKEIMKLPGRNETTEKIQAVRRKIKSLEAEACAVEVALDVRRRQASLLSQVLRDLGQTIQEENLAAMVGEDDLAAMLANESIIGEVFGQGAAQESEATGSGEEEESEEESEEGEGEGEGEEDEGGEGKEGREGKRARDEGGEDGSEEPSSKRPRGEESH